MNPQKGTTMEPIGTHYKTPSIVRLSPEALNLNLLGWVRASRKRNLTNVETTLNQQSYDPQACHS